MRPCLCTLLLCAAAAPGQMLTDDQFQIAWSPTGISSLKHVQDIFDTDYVLPGHSFGDLLVRYRAAGATEWQQISNAAVNPAASSPTRLT
jgi:hypothetical protein